MAAVRGRWTGGGRGGARARGGASLLLGLCLGLATATCTSRHTRPREASTPGPATTTTSAEERLTGLLVRQEYVACLAEGDDAVASEEARALRSACLALLHEFSDAERLAGAMREGSSWRALAEAVLAMARGEPGVALGRLRGARDLRAPEATWLYEQVHARHAPTAEALAGLDEALARTQAPTWRAELLALKAEVLARGGASESSGALLRAAHSAQPASARALVGLATRAVDDGDFAQARELSARAVELAPRSWSARFALWRARLANEGQPPPPGWLEDQVAAFAPRIADSAWATFLLAEELRRHGADALACERYEAVAARFPDAPFAYAASYQAALLLSFAPELRGEEATAAALSRFLARPAHANASWRTDICYGLIRLVARGFVPADTPPLGELAACAVAPESVYNQLQRTIAVAGILAEQTGFEAKARALAQEALDSITEEDRRRRPNNLLAGVHLALALLAASAPRSEAWRVHAAAALELVSPYSEVDYRLRLVRQLRRFDERGEATRILEGCAQHPDCVRRLYALSEQVPGGAAGFDHYLEGVRRRLLSARRKQVLARAVPSPSRMPALELVDERGAPATLPEVDALAIKFWSIDCAPCRWDLPAFQEFARSLATAEGRAVVSVNTEDRPERVRGWMKANGYDFPVLYPREALSMTVPTTWVVDRERRLIFAVQGAQEATWVERENTWRLDHVASSSARRAP
ncbi:MAG: redoxin domain-containing protein [Myxococcales bacterium]|nr:redoxin domain-containing protein [Myxococcales bacterium]